MLAIVLLINIATVTLCSPSRYPYVFLLDIGNEEIQETKDEQIRVSMAGGSATLRYPAVGEGDLITHVRVTGVEFEANLMATVIDGGPGYKYAVIAIAGNKNAPYEAVMTFSTLKDITNFKNNYGPNLEQVNEKDINDENLSSEDWHSDSDTQNTQTVHRYESNEAYIEDGPKKADENSIENEEDKNTVHINEVDGPDLAHDEINRRYGDEPIGIPEYQQYYIDDQIPTDIKSPPDRDIIEQNHQPKYNSIDRPENQVPKAEPFIFEPNDEEESVGVVDQNLYNKYTALRPHLADDVEVYSYKPGADAEQEIRVDEPEEMDQMFNDEEIHNSPKNFNNNYYNVDTDETSAVAY